MIERPILKDAKEYEPKLIGPLTKRQSLCAGLGALFGGGAALLLNMAFIPQVSITAGGALFAAFAVFGWAKPYDIPLERFLMDYWKYGVMAPASRKYEIKNPNEELFEGAYLRTERMTKADLEKYRKQAMKQEEKPIP